MTCRPLALVALVALGSGCVEEAELVEDETSPRFSMEWGKTTQRAADCDPLLDDCLESTLEEPSAECREDGRRFLCDVGVRLRVDANVSALGGHIHALLSTGGDDRTFDRDVGRGHTSFGGAWSEVVEFTDSGEYQRSWSLDAFFESDGMFGRRSLDASAAATVRISVDRRDVARESGTPATTDSAIA